MDYRLLPATEDDKPFLKELYFELRSPEFLPLNLPKPALDHLLEMQFRAQTMGYAQQFPNLETSVVRVGPYPVGRMLVCQDQAAIRLVDIAILQAFRGHGIGASLIQTLQQRALAADLPLRLAVRPENPAIRLYKRLGFVPQSSSPVNIEMEWGGIPQPQPETPTADVASAPVSPGPNSAYFRSICGTKALCHSSTPGRQPLKLVSVRPLRPDPNPRVTLGDSFALTFEGDAASLLPQSIYSIEFQDGNRQDIFLVPITVRDGIATYESIFNRMSLSTEPG